jgi:hypothetical protein
MFIGAAGGERVIKSGRGVISIAISDTTGSATVYQSDGAGGWNPMVIDGDAVVIDSNNTMQGVYAPCELYLVAVGTGVFLKG